MVIRPDEDDILIRRRRGPIDDPILEQRLPALHIHEPRGDLQVRPVVRRRLRRWNPT